MAELHEVAWYKDAYDARTKQNDMLKSLLHLQMQSMEQVKKVNKHIKDHDASNACESLTTRIDLLYQEKKKMEARRELLATQAHELEMCMSMQRTSHVPGIGNSRRVSI